MQTNHLFYHQRPHIMAIDINYRHRLLLTLIRVNGRDAIGVNGTRNNQVFTFKFKYPVASLITSDTL